MINRGFFWKERALFRQHYLIKLHGSLEKTLAVALFSLTGKIKLFTPVF